MSTNSLNNQTTNSNFTVNVTTDGVGSNLIVNHLSGANAANTASIITQTKAGGGDSYHLTMVDGTRSLCWGMDVSDNYALKETTFAGGTGSPSFGTTIRKLTIAGEQTLPLQTSFLADATPNPNATGNGTLAQGLFGTLIAQQGSSYNALTSTFTCPVTGWYQFEAQPLLGGLTAAHTTGEAGFSVNGVPSAKMWSLNPFAVTNGLGTGLLLPMSARLYLNAGDTVTVWVQVYSGALVVSIGGQYFSGALIC